MTVDTDFRPAVNMSMDSHRFARLGGQSSKDTTELRPWGSLGPGGASLTQCLSLWWNLVFTLKNQFREDSWPTGCDSCSQGPEMGAL